MGINFAEAEGRSNFTPVPRGRYHVKITEITDTEVKNDGGKLAAGTPGANFEFIIQEGPYESRRLWNNFWFAPSTAGFLKLCLEATGEFSDEELNSDNFDLDEQYDRIIGLDLVVGVKIRRGSGEYEDSNAITGYFEYDESVDYSSAGAPSESSASFLPG